MQLVEKNHMNQMLKCRVRIAPSQIVAEKTLTTVKICNTAVRIKELLPKSV